ncbi:hypothetical protein ROLI_012930 [Roseobacter fucihabitans]|uniref:Peptidase S1 domain-containing protein n=1 Tax=Roseobacter fucihabitans TaxID=1537242 RepID=A0ABZ2BQE1_9RHOB|nr:trypsin-like serine protease [Roseobacter litoralis]MBC6964180.1 Trypsin [Roseobacter litoralis]
MRQPYALLFILLSALGAAFGSVQTVRAEPLPALAGALRAQWVAVGLVNTAGFRDKSSCTGTLIAPDLVLTAAHCVSAVLQRNRTRHFVAGWDRGSFAAHRLSKRIDIHPDYAGEQGDDKVRHDIAVIQLSTPIEVGDVTPHALRKPDSRTVQNLAVLGYHRKRPHVINGRFDCAKQAGSDAERLLLDCEVIAGNSGGPVLARGGDGWMVIGVISARLNATPPRSIAVPIDDWVLSHWRAAMARATPGQSDP